MVNQANRSTQNQTHHTLAVNMLRRIARIALIVSAISIGSLALLILNFDTPTGDYLTILQMLTNSHNNLLYIMFITGAWLIAATAITTYFITLYSSFRVAGPLYRFAKNLKFGHQHEMPMIKIRKYDYFQEECQQMDEGIETLLAHYQSLSSEVEKLQALPTSSIADKKIVLNKIQQLSKLASRLTL
tara:strand:+ start:27513 stop:28073 length:561 start_codon:yes stop_codon:yes gene_type:complete